jgi:hypothetical protein
MFIDQIALSDAFFPLAVAFAQPSRAQIHIYGALIR